MRSKPITTFDNLVSYTLYEDGIIVNDRTGKQLKQSIGKKGGLKCTLYRVDGTRKSITVPHLLLAEFCGIKYEPNKVVKYKDGNKNNINLDNLEYTLFKPTRVYSKPKKREGVIRYCETCNYEIYTIDKLEEFVTQSDCDYGKRNLCKPCRQAQRNLASGGTFSNRLVLPEHLQQKRSYLENREKRLAKVKEYAQNNRGKCNALSKKYKMDKEQRTPKWLTDDDFWLMEQAYIVAQERTEKYGIQFHVDHIIPLRGKYVSGFHCPTNLQVIPWHENISKSNKYEVA